MRAIDWRQFLDEQREKHGKVVFTLTELANVSGRQPRSLSVGLQRLVAHGVIQRYADGRYGLPGAVRAEDLVPSLDPAAYITGMQALYRHQLITQVPTEISCFTNRRHNRSRVRSTPFGRVVFVTVQNAVYAHPGERAVAGPEQALCDFVHLCRKRGVEPAAVVTFRNLDRLDTEQLEKHLPRYPKTVQVAVVQLRKGGVNGGSRLNR